jgi:hypothetical protein
MQRPRRLLAGDLHVRGGAGALREIITAASILLGFIFAGFWWALDRELKYPPDQRHLKLAYVLLIMTAIMLAVFGIILPLHSLAKADSALRKPLIGVAAGLVGVVGYMLTEFGHYDVYRWPLYTTRTEWFFFIATVLLVIGLLAWAFS